MSRSHDGARGGRLPRARATGADRAKPAPATEQAVAAIMHMITAGELGPGDRLPTERDLALRLGISRSTIREALHGLNMLRVLDVRHGDGIFITSLDARSLLEVTGFAIQLLREIVQTYNERVSFTITKFDGTKAVLGSS